MPTSAEAPAALRVCDLTAGYGAGTVVKGVSLEVRPGERLCIIGPNGAGKSTLLRVLSGLRPPVSGTVSLLGQDVTHAPPDVRLRRGLVLVPEGRGIFYGLTVDENLTMGSVAFPRAQELENRERVLTIFPILRQFRTRLAGLLSGGQQQMLAIARGLMAGPRVLMLDEPSLGLSPQAIRELVASLEAWCAAYDTAVLLVEQNSSVALRFAQRAYVMARGQFVYAGDTAAMAADGSLLKYYLQ
jgi:branched-chain amino acid transport system ATP-binding protein